MSRKDKAFTLIELMISIVIISILGTIAFMSYQGYTNDARDAKRLSDIDSIKKSLTLYRTMEGTYPLPSEGEVVTYSGDTVWTQGIFGESVISKLGSKGNISNVPLDPLTDSKYTYSVINTKKEYQLAVVFEGDTSSNINIIKDTYAAGSYGTTKVVGDYNGKVIKIGNCSNLKVLAVPSIIKGDTSETELTNIINEKKLVYNNSKILPKSYNGGTRFSDKLPTGNIVNIASIEAFTGKCVDLKEDIEQEKLTEKLRNAYTDTVLEEQDKIKPIVKSIGNEQYIAQQIINTSITSSVKVTAIDNGLSAGPKTILDCKNSGEIIYGTFDGTSNGLTCDDDIIICSGNGFGYTIASCNVGANVVGLNGDSNGDLIAFGKSESVLSGGPESWGVPLSIATTAKYESSTVDNKIKMKGPCKNGYHVPTAKEFNLMLSAGSFGTNGNIVSNKLFLPKNVGRIIGGNYESGSYAAYRTSSAADSHTMYFWWLDDTTTTSVGSNQDLSYGYSVRCFKD